MSDGREGGRTWTGACASSQQRHHFLPSREACFFAAPFGNSGSSFGGEGVTKGEIGGGHAGTGEGQTDGRREGGSDGWREGGLEGGRMRGRVGGRVADTEMSPGRDACPLLVP